MNKQRFFRVMRTQLKLQRTYKKNSLIWSLRQIPLIKKLIPESCYGSEEIQNILNVIGILRIFFGQLLSKAFYVGIMLVFPAVFLAEKGLVNVRESFLFSFVFLSIVGFFARSTITEFTQDRYYVIVLMRINAKESMLADTLYKLCCYVIFMLPSLTVGAIFCKVPVWVVPILLLFGVLGKIGFANIAFLNAEKDQEKLKRKKEMLSCILALIIIAAGYAVPMIENGVSVFLLGAGIFLTAIGSVCSLKNLLHYEEKRYYRVFKKSYQENKEMDALVNNGLQENATYHDKIATNTAGDESKHGYAYFNDLFVKRHWKILGRQAKRITIVAAVLSVAALGLILFAKKSDKDNLDSFMLIVATIPMILYACNSGLAVTEAMYRNCDHSMLTYRFYRKSEVIRAMFWQRLRSLVMINAKPACMLGVFYVLMCFYTVRWQESIFVYLMVFVSVLGFSVFFSVHNLAMYYLLQPYNMEGESKSGLYTFIRTMTYLLAYNFIGKKIPVILFGVGAIVFCVVYVLLALVLVSKFAPKTFRIRSGS